MQVPRKASVTDRGTNGARITINHLFIFTKLSPLDVPISFEKFIKPDSCKFTTALFDSAMVNRAKMCGKNMILVCGFTVHC